MLLLFKFSSMLSLALCCRLFCCFLCHRLFSFRFSLPDVVDAAAFTAAITVAFYSMLNFILSRVFHVLFISYCVPVSVLNRQLLGILLNCIQFGACVYEGMRQKRAVSFMF